MRIDEVASVALVGNGPIAGDCASAIDSHSVVIRFNGCLTCGVYGKRCDAVVMANAGLAGWRLAHEPGALSTSAFDDAKVIVFSKGPEVTAEALAAGRCAGDWVDHSQEILARLQLSIAWRWMPTDVYMQACRTLGCDLASTSLEPSSGALAVAWLIASGARNMVLFGFSHQGWAGHNWAKEAEWLKSLSPRVTYGKCW